MENDMNWYDAALAIKRAQENNQLVIFVGAGVSANSGIPTWGELIEKKAAKIEYDNKEKELEQDSSSFHIDEKCTMRFSLVIPPNNHRCFFDLFPHINSTNTGDTID